MSWFPFQLPPPEGGSGPFSNVIFVESGAVTYQTKSYRDSTSYTGDGNSILPSIIQFRITPAQIPSPIYDTKSYLNTANFGDNAFLPNPVQFRINPPLLWVPFSSLSYRDTYELPRNQSIYNQTSEPPFLGLSLPVPFNTTAYIDPSFFSECPVNPNLYIPPAVVNPFVNIWLSR